MAKRGPKVYRPNILVHLKNGHQIHLEKHHESGGYRPVYVRKEGNRNFVLRKEEWEEVKLLVKKYYDYILMLEMEWRAVNQRYDNLDKKKHRRERNKLARRTWDIFYEVYPEEVKPEPMRKDRSGFVYLAAIEFGADAVFYKVGRTKHFKRRIHQLERALLRKIEPVRIFLCNDYYKGERFFHNKFDGKKIGGEFYKLENEDLKWLETLEGIDTDALLPISFETAEYLGNIEESGGGKWDRIKY